MNRQSGKRIIGRPDREKTIAAIEQAVKCLNIREIMHSAVKSELERLRAKLNNPSIGSRVKEDLTVATCERRAAETIKNEIKGSSYIQDEKDLKRQLDEILRKLDFKGLVSQRLKELVSDEIARHKGKII